MKGSNMIKRTILITIAIVFVSQTARTAQAEFDPGHGRFMQRDPLGTHEFIQWKNGKPTHETSYEQNQLYKDGFNLYEYVKSTPITLVDPTGMEGGQTDCWLNGILAPYGNWCGACGTTGKPLAIDLVDLACCHHDQCFSPEKAGGWGNLLWHIFGVFDWPEIKPLRNCDRMLCRRLYCLGTLKGDAKRVRDQAYFWFRCERRYFNNWNKQCNSYSVPETSKCKLNKKCGTQPKK